MKNVEFANINLKELNGQTITLGQLIDGIKSMTNNSNISTNINLKSKIYVPMYQRNYKWNQETAVKFIHELFEAFKKKEDKTISLFTLYIDRDYNIQVVDGQQRMITLLLLYKAIKKEECFISLEFERDDELNGDSRIKFIDKISNKLFLNRNNHDCDWLKNLDLDNINLKDCELLIWEERALSDKRRLLYNFLGILKELNNSKVYDIDTFIEFLRQKVKLLLHITEDEPVSEFLNVNCNKTKFSICDRVRSKLITYNTFNSVKGDKKEFIATALECKDYKKGISTLFEELTRLLYCDDIYNTVKLGYDDPEEFKENRINIMFHTLVNNPNMGYMECKSLENVDIINLLKKLNFYKTILTELEVDFLKEHYVTSNAFKNFYHHNSILFFDLIDQYFNKYFEKYFENEKTVLSQILHTEHSIDRVIIDCTELGDIGEYIYFVNSYFQVLSNNEPSNDQTKYETLLKEEYKQQTSNKSKYVPLGKESFEDIVQGSGKYILYRYIDQHQKENDNKIKFSPTLTLEENQEIHYEDMEQKDIIPSKISIRELLCSENRRIIIPVIQRDYCMGSHLGKLGKTDVLDYIIKSFCDGKNEVTLSAITIFQPNKKDIYVYDGQQRIFTLAALIKLLDGENSSTDICDFFFEQRENFNKFVEDFFKYKKKDFKSIDSYAKKSVVNLNNILYKKLSNNKINLKEFQNYILDKIHLDVVIVNGALSSAEQFFIEINDGVQLVPYEIFKCKINAKYKELVKEADNEKIDKYKKWIRLIDNDWLDFFYRYNDTKIDNESSNEELLEMRFIEFCCRMIYWEKYLINRDDKTHPLNLKGFVNSQNSSDIGDCDKFIEHLELKDFERIENIFNNLIELDLKDTGDTNPIVFKGEYLEYNMLNDKWEKSSRTIGIPYYNEEFNFEHGKYYLNQFIKNLKYPLEKERNKDIVIWKILNVLSEKKFKKIIDVIKRWNSSIIYNKPFAYITPSFIGKYEYAIIPIPSYYYEKNHINIYEKLPLKKISKDDEFEIYDKILMCNKNTEEYEENKASVLSTNTQSISYEIYYSYKSSKYNNNKYRNANVSGEIFVGRYAEGGGKKEIYVKNGNKYIYFRELSESNFYKDLYNGHLDSSNSKKRLYIDGLVFRSNGKPYYIILE